MTRLLKVTEATGFLCAILKLSQVRVCMCVSYHYRKLSHFFSFSLYITSLRGYTVIGSVWFSNAYSGKFGLHPERGCDLFKEWRTKKKRKRNSCWKLVVEPSMYLMLLRKLCPLIPL